MQETKSFAITGTKHGSIVEAACEGDARKAFHKKYNGESILYCKDRNSKHYFLNLLIENDKLNK